MNSVAGLNQAAGVLSGLKGNSVSTQPKGCCVMFLLLIIFDGNGDPESGQAQFMLTNSPRAFWNENSHLAN